LNWGRTQDLENTAFNSLGAVKKRETCSFFHGCKTAVKYYKSELAALKQRFQDAPPDVDFCDAYDPYPNSQPMSLKDELGVAWVSDASFLTDRNRRRPTAISQHRPLPPR